MKILEVGKLNKEQYEKIKKRIDEINNKMCQNRILWISETKSPPKEKHRFSHYSKRRK